VRLHSGPATCEDGKNLYFVVVDRMFENTIHTIPGIIHGLVFHYLPGGVLPLTNSRRFRKSRTRFSQLVILSNSAGRYASYQ
jgi:hypothetical protein